MASADPSSTPPGRPPDRPPSLARTLAEAVELPFLPIAAVLIAGGLGYWIDERLHTSPLFTFGLGLVGFLAGMLEIYRRLSRQEKQDGGK